MSDIQLINWKAHLEACKGLEISEEAIRWFSLITPHIGFDQGEIRPGEMGRWDVYYRLLYDFGISQQECLVLSGLSATEVAREERISSLEESYCLDRKDPNFEREVREIEFLSRLTPEQLDDHIRELEAQLLS